MPSSWNTLTPAWWGLLPLNAWLLAALSCPQSSNDSESLSFCQLFWSACSLKTLTCYPSFYAAVLELFDYFALTDRQVGFWYGLAGRLHRWLCTLFHFISHAQHFRFVNSKSVSPPPYRRGLLVDHPSSLQAKVWRREGQGGGWPHSRQRFFRAIPGNHNFIYLHLNWQFAVS